jgi:hypothetical protein
MGQGHCEEMISRFRDECCIVGGRDRTPEKAVWAEWRKWAKASDVASGRRDDLTKRLAARGMAIVLEDDDLFVAGVVLRPGAIRVCRYCHRLIVSETCDCRLDTRIEGWEGPGEAPEERGGSLPPNKLSAPAAEWRRTAPVGAGLRGGGEIGASLRVDRVARMDDYGHGGAGWKQRAPGGSSAKIGKTRSWRDRFSQIPIPKQSVRLRTGGQSVVNVGVTREELESEPAGVLVLDENTLEALLESCSGQTLDAYRDTAILRVLYDTQARVSDLAAPWLRDVDLDAGVLTLRGSEFRRALLSSATTEALHKYLPMRSAKLKRATSTWVASDWLWVARDGSRFTGTAIDAMFRRRCLRAGFGPVHIEEIRHESREATENDAPDQDFGTFQRIDRGAQRRFERGDNWIEVALPDPRLSKLYGTPTYKTIVRDGIDDDLEDVDPVEDDDEDDDPYYFRGPSEEEEEAAQEEAWGLAPGTLAAEEALERQVDEAAKETARLTAEADALAEAWRQELKCSTPGCSNKGVLRKGLCDPCRKYKQRTGRLPTPEVLQHRLWLKESPLTE